MCLCVRETRVCLSAFCHPAIGDSFNCSMTTTRKDQKPHKSQSKLAAIPQWKASHAIITGKKTSSTVAQNHVYLTPIMQLCRYHNNNELCPNRTEVPVRKTWTSLVTKECLVARRLNPCQNMKASGEALIWKSSDEFRSASYIVPSQGRALHGINNSFYKTCASSEQFDLNVLISPSKSAMGRIEDTLVKPVTPCAKEGIQSFLSFSRRDHLYLL